MSMLHKNMAKLVDICYSSLNKNKPVQEYLKKRNINKKTIDTFFLGAFPSDLRILIKEFDADFLLHNGIMYKANVSTFKNYPVIIPINDVNANFIGIAGRTILPQEQISIMGYPKYKNSQYDKINHLFGLHIAKKYIRDDNSAITVEGYFDVISSHQSGLKNVVATSGVFLSPKQIALLSRYGENIQLLFDNDQAGQRATERTIKNLAYDGVNIKDIFLPNGYKDIDEYINKAPKPHFYQNIK